MKKICTALLLVLAGLLLAGCGTQDMTLSEWIEVAENWRLPGMRNDTPDNALPDADELTVEEDEEAAALLQAQMEALATLRASLLGSWSELSDALPLFRPIVSWYGDLVLKEDGTYLSESTSGTWDLSEDGARVTLRGTRGRTVAEIVQDGDYLKLSVPELRLNFLRSKELDDYIRERFVFSEISLENVKDYLSAPVYIGVIPDEKDRPTDDSAWVLGSRAYREGLVYYGRSEDFRAVIQNNATGSMTLGIPYDTLALRTGASFGHFTDASGTLVFIRSEYVADNRMTDARTRTLTFTDGTTHTTSLTWYSDLADYADWRF